MIPVIISGGSGSRLWPMSRSLDPKPFLKLNNQSSLLQNTFIRAVSLDNVKNVLTVTNDKIHFRMQDEYQQVNDKEVICDFILEPFGRNTAPAIALASLFAKANYAKDEVLLILPADHLITDLDKFKQAVNQATQIAKDGYIVTFGIKPQYPETGYGYIEEDHNCAIKTGYKVNRFVEKPDFATANEYLESGKYLWNSGMFCATVETFIQQFGLYAQDVLELSQECLNQSKIDTVKSSKIVHLDSAKFAKAANISVDYALLEKSDKMAVIPCEIGWSDIGSWLSIAQNLPKDNKNNAVIGESILHNSQDCLVYSTDRIVAGVDLNDIAIIDTPDALLVAHKNHTQNVKQIFEKLKASNHKTSEIHQTAHRPWGTYTVLEDGDNYKVKRIEVKPGASLSLQMHHRRAEHWIVIEGVATVTNGDKVLELQVNQSTYISKETKHRLENKTDCAMAIIEIQCGDYLEEDDIVRFEDVYGRTAN